MNQPRNQTCEAAEPSAVTADLDRGPGLAPAERPIRVAVTYRACPHWRAPMFARLNSVPGLRVRVFHGRDLPGTKHINTRDWDGFEHQEMWGFAYYIRFAGRQSACFFWPLVWWSLLRWRPDVILAEGGGNVFNNILIYAFAKLSRTPLIWWTLGEIPGRQYRGVRRLYRAVVVAMERSADVLLGFSSVALAYFQRMGYPREKWFRAVNVVDTERVLQDIATGRERVPALRAELNLANRQVVLFVGALIEEKRIERLLRAFARVRAAAPHALLLMVGDGPDRVRLERLAQELGIAGDTLFAGQIIRGVSEYYELGDVFVLPGLGGLAVSEAMVHGLPVICTQGDGCEVDLVRDGQTGFRLPEGNDQQLEDLLEVRMLEVLADPRRRERMGAAARDVIEREHNVNTYVDNFVDAIRYASTGRRLTPIPVPRLHPGGEVKPDGGAATSNMPRSRRPSAGSQPFGGPHAR